MQPLAQPPRNNDPRFDDWMFRLWRRIASNAGLSWSLIDKTDSNLTDLTTRNHADLQNINTANYTHLTATNATDLTDGGNTILHQHTRYLDVAAVHFPFYNSSSVLDTISLNADLSFPFYDSTGSVDNIPMTT